MLLRESMQHQGKYLFKWRSYLPMLAIPLCVVALAQSNSLEKRYGSTVALCWEVFTIAVSFLGLYVRCLVAGYVPKGTSGRNTQSQVADSLNTTGMYSIVRNPLYLANYFITLGMLLFVEVWWLAVIGTLGFLFYYERVILAEEDFLVQKFGESYRVWAKNTPVIIPKLSLWQRACLSFSLVTVLRREHSTFFAIIASFTFLNIAKDFFIEKRIVIQFGWMLFFVSGLIIYNLLRFFKKKTKILNVKGR